MEKSRFLGPVPQALVAGLSLRNVHYLFFTQMEADMYVVFAEELEGAPAGASNSARTLDEAFACICCRCGLSYRIMPGDEGWRLELTDVERPDRSPMPIHSSYKKPRDAQHDLMTQALDGRIRGHVAIRNDLFGRARIMRNAQGTFLLAEDRR
jgi:hypothetical protein